MAARSPVAGCGYITRVFGQLLIGRAADELTAEFCALILDRTMEDQTIDLVAECYDVVIRLNPATQTTP